MAAIDKLKPPARGFTKAERKWIEEVLIPAIKTVRAIQGKDATVSEYDDQGQVIGAKDCGPCAS